MVRVDGNGIERTGDRNEPGACPQCTARAEPCGPRRMRWPRHGDRMPARVLVPLACRLRKRGAPKRRTIRESLRRDFAEDAVRNADVGHAQHPAKFTPRQQQDAPASAGKNVTVSVARSTGPLGIPASPSSPLGTSTASTGVRCSATAAITSAATPSIGRDRPAPNDRVDHEMQTVELKRIERPHRPVEAPRHLARIALEISLVAQADRGARRSWPA